MERKVLSIFSFLVVVLIFTSGYAGMPIPSDIKKTVCFILIKGTDGKYVPNGTGFFVVTENSSKSIMYGYLVTAKHVLRSSPEKDEYFPEIFIRLTKTKGGVEQLRIPIIRDGKNKNLFLHHDPTVDIAVIPAIPEIQLYDFKTLPSSMLTTKEDVKAMNITEGADVFFTGMFTSYLGNDKNYPIVRFGRMALLSEEKIEFDKMLRDLYLVEIFSFGGNSGSPVFFYLGSDRMPGSLIVDSPVLKLAGVMLGTYVKRSPLQEILTGGTQTVSLDNIGIAAVVPSYYLWEIIFSEELKKLREG